MRITILALAMMIGLVGAAPLMALDALLSASGASFERKLRRLQRLTDLTLAAVNAAVSSDAEAICFLAS